MLKKSLVDINAIQFGEFTLKSGVLSPVYVDLRKVVSYPEVLKLTASALWEKASGISFDCVCGVPYTALPMATALSLAYNVPMVMRRKEKKEYGTKKSIEGSFAKGAVCLVVEDVVTSGMSIFETIESLEEAGLIVKDIVVVVDREQGGRERLESKGYRLHQIFTLKELLSEVGIS